MKRLFVRCFLGILIILNIILIFGFSSESGSQSDKTSQQVTEGVANVVIKDYASRPPAEQTQIIAKMHPSVRTLAHMSEYAMLAFLIMLLVKTWRLHSLLCAGISLAATLLCATADELYQHFLQEGRAGEVKDVGFDMLGALIGCSFLYLLILLAALLKQRAEKKPLRVTAYSISSQKVPRPLRIAVAADLHDNPANRTVEALKREKPDLILIPGDLTDDKQIRAGGAAALAFLKDCAAIAPTFYSLGNHEIACYHKGNPFRHPIPIAVSPAFKETVSQVGATLLDNCGIHFNGNVIFGLTSGIRKKANHPDATALARFAEMNGDLKILLCHHPEYYMPYLKATDADLVVCGHAHGGHWRFFGRGVYAPGQGLFPKYTSGVVDGRCVISRGIGNHTSIPRLFNSTELVLITIEPQV